MKDEKFEAWINKHTAVSSLRDNLKSVLETVTDYDDEVLDKIVYLQMRTIKNDLLDCGVPSDETNR